MEAFNQLGVIMANAPLEQVQAKSGDATEHVARRDDDTDAVVQLFGAIGPGVLVDRRYRVGSKLGEGGFCVVYSARHVGTEQAVALKVLRRIGQGAESRERFLREARVTASLRHAHTVRVFDVGETETGAMYLAMEQLQGPTLETALATRKDNGGVFNEAEAIDLAVQVLGSLDEAHRAGLVHRDLRG